MIKSDLTTALGLENKEARREGIRAYSLPLLLGLAAASLTAVVRFLPVFDYPHWIYQAHVLAHFSDYAQWFELKWGPVPNLGSSLFLWPLAPWLGAETAGRLLTGLYALALVLAFFYLVRGSFKASGLALLGPVFVYNYFFYNGFLSFVLGLPLLLLTLGLFERTREWTAVRWCLLSALSVLAYFCHLFIWLPLLLYALLAGILSGRPKSLIIYASTQAAPLLLWLAYTFPRPTFTSESSGAATKMYFSLPNKAFSVVAPLLPFSRTDPFPAPFPILVLNLAFALAVALILLLALRHFDFHPAGRQALALPLTAVVLLVTAVIFPFQWFGVGAVDQRLVFLGFLLLMAAAGRFIRPGLAPLAIMVALLTLAFQLFIFVQNDTYLEPIHAALQARKPGATLHVVSLRHPPIYGECQPEIWNTGHGVFPLQWFPIFDIVERDHLPVWTFNTALLHNRRDMPTQVMFTEYDSAEEQQQFAHSFATSQPWYDYLVLFGCPQDIASVARVWESGPLATLVNRGPYHALLKIRRSDAG